MDTVVYIRRLGAVAFKSQFADAGALLVKYSLRHTVEKGELMHAIRCAIETTPDLLTRLTVAPGSSRRTARVCRAGVLLVS